MWTLRLVVVICLGLALRAMGIAWVTLSDLERYRQLEAAGLPVLRIGINGLLGIVLISTTWGLYRKRSWAFRYFWGIIAASLAVQWLWLAVYAQADFDRGRLAFSAVTSLLLLGLLWWLRWRLRKIFGEPNERTSSQE